MMQSDKPLIVLKEGSIKMAILDTVMLGAFVLFMVFIFGGYHKTKSEHREKQEHKKLK